MRLQLQIACGEGCEAPTHEQVESWVSAALKKAARAQAERCRGEVTIRVVGRTEMAGLNQRYRGKTGATNVLAFPFEAVEEVPSDILGDVVICAPLVAEQATAQRKPPMHHWAHLIIHGILHLCGFDHEREDTATQMESLEQEILSEFGIASPYDPVPSVR